MTTQELVTQEVKRALKEAGRTDWLMVEDRKFSNEGTWRFYDNEYELQGEIGFSFGPDSFTLVFGDDLRHIRQGSAYAAHHLRAAFTSIFDFFEAEA